MTTEKRKFEQPLAERPNTDHAKQLSSPKRRLDSLADLCASYSQCIAVTVIDKQLYIAANELADQKYGYKTPLKASIEQVFHYLVKLDALQKKAKRALMFQYICCDTRPILFQNKYIAVTPKVSKRIAELVFEHRETGNTFEGFMRDFRKKDYNNENHVAPLLAKYDRLYSDLIKLENIMETKPEKLDTKAQDNDISAEKLLSVLQKKAEILENAGEMVHAEMQILEHIMRKVIEKNYLKQRGQTGEKREIYIGISKRCCLHCNAMLEAANEIFKENGIPVILKFRGSHNLNFPWNPPKLFPEALSYLRDSDSDLPPALLFSRSSKDVSTLTDDPFTALIGQISERAGLKILALLKVPKNVAGSFRSMERRDSDSDPEQEYEFDVSVQLRKLRGNLDFLKKWSNGDMRGAISETMVAINFYSLREFAVLFDLPFKSLGQPRTGDSFLRNRLIALCGRYNSKYSKEMPVKVKVGELLTILKNPALVGDVMSEYIYQLAPSIEKALLAGSQSLPSSFSSSSFSSSSSGSSSSSSSSSSFSSSSSSSSFSKISHPTVPVQRFQFLEEERSRESAGSTTEKAGTEADEIKKQALSFRMALSKMEMDKRKEAKKEEDYFESLDHKTPSERIADLQKEIERLRFTLSLEPTQEPLLNDFDFNNDKLKFIDYLKDEYSRLNENVRKSKYLGDRDYITQDSVLDKYTHVTDPLSC